MRREGTMGGRRGRTAVVLAVILVAGCTKIEPSPIVRDDGTLLYCPNPYNSRHVLMAAREYCAPKPAQPLGYAPCPDDPLENGPVFNCGYNPGYEPLEIEDATPAEPAQEDMPDEAGETGETDESAESAGTEDEDAGIADPEADTAEDG